MTPENESALTESINNLIAATKASTAAVLSLTETWAKLTARAKQLDAKEGGTLTAAGVPVAEIGPKVAAQADAADATAADAKHQPEGFVL
jgi:hypothetical protein